MLDRSFFIIAVLWLTATCPLPCFAQEADKQFSQRVKPFLNAYCIGCHSGTNAAAQLDLTQYRSTADLAKDHARWALIEERMESLSMPPKGVKQPSGEDREAVQIWIRSFLQAEAAKNAGDPGLVLTRRLSNAEYNNSIRDLTGYDLKPAREFPVDPTNAAGFDNSGESLAMSPSLLNKYLQAAREVSTHLVLGANGIRFAPHPMLAETDREKYTIQRIVDFYDRQPTDYAAYFEAAWKFKHRASLGKPDSSLVSLAAEAKLSARYLAKVWDFLEGPSEPVGPDARLHTMWRVLPSGDPRQFDLVRESAIKMRDYILRIRKLTARQFRSPRVEGLSGTSQPLMNWKLRSYASHRLDFDPSALQVEGEAPMVIPPPRRGGGVPSEDEVAGRNAAIAARARAGDPDLLVPAGQRQAYEASFARVAKVFPDAFYIRERGRFYPDDSEDKGRLLSAGFHNVMGYFRDDTPLMDLMLTEEQRNELDTLWLEFDTIADYTTRTYVQFFFNQSGEVEGRGRESGSFRPSDKEVTSEKVIFGVRDTYLAKAKVSGDALAEEAIREHFARVNASIRAVEKARLDAEPRQLSSLLDFANRAYRRPLTASERSSIMDYYRELRDKSNLPHEDAMRDLVVLVLMSPDFCFHVDHAEPLPPNQVAPRTRPSRKAPPVVSEKTKPLSGYALASRLSFLLWSSVPDQELQALAAKGELQRPDVIKAQIRRMLKDKRSLALATEFAGNWLDFRRFEDHNSVDRTRFTSFTNDLRQAMFEEPVRYIDDVIRNERSILDLLYGQHTFVNRTLARHYGIPEMRIPQGEWIRVSDARRYGRGGLLPMAAFLTRNSPGLRTSPVKRGYWVAKTLLGEAIPPPPASVPELPEDESKMDLPLRQMLANHRKNPSCAGCHARFDGFGLAFEGYGPIGEKRTHDLAGRPVDTSAEFPGGVEGKSIDDVLDFIRARREAGFVNNLLRKLLAYALGRSLQLSDEPLLERMRTALDANDKKFSALIESIAVSPQFLEQRNPFLQTRIPEARKAD